MPHPFVSWSFPVVDIGQGSVKEEIPPVPPYYYNRHARASACASVSSVLGTVTIYPTEQLGDTTWHACDVPKDLQAC